MIADHPPDRRLAWSAIARLTAATLLLLAAWVQGEARPGTAPRRPEASGRLQTWNIIGRVSVPRSLQTTGIGGW
jgi:hypothetical protein